MSRQKKNKRGDARLHCSAYAACLCFFLVRCGDAAGIRIRQRPKAKLVEPNTNSLNNWLVDLVLVTPPAQK